MGFLRRVATAPTVYGIETPIIRTIPIIINTVATAPTVYGIETAISPPNTLTFFFAMLQQHLPFTVLKRCVFRTQRFKLAVATAPTVYGIETNLALDTPI